MFFEPITILHFVRAYGAVTDDTRMCDVSGSGAIWVTLLMRKRRHLSPPGFQGLRMNTRFFGGVVLNTYNLAEGKQVTAEFGDEF
jgi:hypothetical protein